MTRGALIVGASQAGMQLAVTLRDLGYAHPVTLVGAEPEAPYQRPPLSKTFLFGDSEPRDLPFRNVEFYADLDIELVRGERVETIEIAPHGGGRARTRKGRILDFDDLALTVGGRPRKARFPGADISGVHYLRDLADARGLRGELLAASAIVVVGGGFIGLEVAASARAHGKDITVVEVADRLLGRAVAPVVSDFYRDAHQRRGTRIRLGAGIEAVTSRDGRVSGVALTDGSSIAADLVVVGIGIEPRLELAEGLGLRCDRGIVVDEHARTSHPGVVAAGDCTVFPHPLTGDGLVHVESVQNAVDQAKVAAATLMGIDESHHGVPWFWSDQDRLKLQIAGLSHGYDATVLRGDPDSERFSVLYYRGDQLLAVDAVNRAPDYLAVRRALAAGGSLPRTLAADPSTPLKELIVPPAQSQKSAQLLKAEVGSAH